MTEILQLINNLDSVDFLDPGTINLISWEPSLPPRKDSIYTPVYGNGSTLISSQFDNLVETITLSIAGNSQDSVITNFRNLTSILEAAKAYYIGLKSTPTYLRAKANNETGTRYAIVKNYKLDKISQVIGATPFGSSGIKVLGQAYVSGFPQIVLVLELDLWRDQAPGSYDTILASNSETFNSRVYGAVNSSQVITPLASVYATGKYHKANISHAFAFDSSAGTFSSNLIGASLPTNLFPSPIGSLDTLYLGCQTSITDSGPFSNVIFDIATPASVAMTIAWEYWDGLSWSGLVHVDETDGFSLSGVREVVWRNTNGISGFGITTINGITAFWIRARITNLNGNSTVPTQQNRSVYAVTWPFVEINSDQVSGDVTALSRYVITTFSSISASDTVTTNMIIGLRSTSRGSNFIAYWNASDEQNPTGISYSAATGLTSDATLPTGRKHSAITVNSSDAQMGIFTALSSYAHEYKGRFRVFLGLQIVSITGNPEDFSFYLRVTQPSDITYYQTDYKSPLFSTLSTPMYIDMGEISISDKVGPDENMANDLTIAIRGVALGSSTATVEIINIVLLPVDEWSCEVQGRLVLKVEAAYLEINGTKDKIELTAISRSISSSALFYYPVYNSTTPPILQINSTQRLWFVAIGEDGIMNPDYTIKVTSSLVKRYLALRGSD